MLAGRLLPRGGGGNRGGDRGPKAGDVPRGGRGPGEVIVGDPHVVFLLNQDAVTEPFGGDVGREADDIPPVKLGRLANVIAAPHIGGMVPDSMLSQAEDTVEQVAAILAGRMPKFPVNPDQATRFKALSLRHGRA